MGEELTVGGLTVGEGLTVGRGSLWGGAHCGGKGLTVGGGAHCGKGLTVGGRGSLWREGLTVVGVDGPHDPLKKNG